MGTEILEAGSTADAYRRRLERYVTAMDLGRPDRVPVRLSLGDVAAGYAGMTKQEVFYDLDRNLAAARFVADRFDLDLAPGSPSEYWAPLMDCVNAVYYRFPGRGLPANGQFQYVEGEYMLADDYPRFIAEPTAWILETYLPRVQREMAEPGSLRAQLALIRGTAAAAHLAARRRELQEVMAREHGLPPSTSGKAYAPFDVLGDKLRGMRGVLLDVHRRPEQLLEAADMLVGHVIHKILTGAGGDATLPASMPLHRGAYPFLSPAQWERFYWPSLRKVIEGLWSVGKRTMFVAEADWTPYLESIADLPARSIVFHVDQTDLAMAAQLFKDRFCLTGNVPNHVLAYGTPKDVRDYTRRLVETYAGDGGFIVAAAAGIMDPVQLANVEALVDSAHELAVGPSATPSPGGADAASAPRQDGTGDARASDPSRAPRGAECTAAGLPDGATTTGALPGVCVPWSEVATHLGEVLGDVELVRREWELLDDLAYNYLWSWIA